MPSTTTSLDPSDQTGTQGEQGEQGAGGGGAQDWKANLPDALKNDPSIQSFTDLDSAVKSLIETKALVGADKLAIPGKDAAPEVWNEFWGKLGRPETAESYQMPTEGLPEGIEIPPDMVKSFHEKAHTIGLSDTQAAELYRWQMEQLKGAGESLGARSQEERDANETTLKSEYGEAYDERMALAKAAVREFGDQGLVDYLEETGLGNDPRLVKAFVKIGQAIASDPIQGIGLGAQFGVSPGEADRKIAELERDEKFMKVYTNPHDPGYKAAVAEMSKLFQQKHPKEAS